MPSPVLTVKLKVAIYSLITFSAYEGQWLIDFTWRDWETMATHF